MGGDAGRVQVTLKGTDGSVAEIYPFGGVVTSWVKDGRDVLYVRPDAKFDKSKPISGGIPHCWPQFGPGELHTASTAPVWSSSYFRLSHRTAQAMVCGYCSSARGVSPPNTRRMQATCRCTVSLATWTGR